MNTTVLILGIALVSAAIVGGGLEAAGIKIPPLASFKRQVLLACFGLLLIVISWRIPSPSPPGPSPTPTQSIPSPTPFPTTPTPLLSMSSPFERDLKEPPEEKEKSLPSADRQAAEKLGRDWLDALWRKDINSLVSMSALPFHKMEFRYAEDFDQMREQYKKWTDSGLTSILPSKTKEIAICTIKDWKKRRLSEYPELATMIPYVMDKLRVNDDDLVIIIVAENLDSKPIEELPLFTRKVGGVLKLVGWGF